MIRLIQKVKNNLKTSIKINSKFVQFDSTPPLDTIKPFRKIMHESGEWLKQMPTILGNTIARKK